MRARPPEPPKRVAAANKSARAEGFEPPTKPGVGSRRSTTELRACGRRGGRGRTDGLPSFGRALDGPEPLAEDVQARWTWPGSNRPPPRCRRGALPLMSYRPGIRPPCRRAVCSCPMGQASRVPSDRAGPSSTVARLAISPISRRTTVEKRALTGPSRSSRTDPVLLIRNRLSAPHHGGRAQPASVPPLRAGVESWEMETRVGSPADPPCVSGLLCRCKGAEHLKGARWWKRGTIPPVPRGSRSRLRPVP